MTREENTVQTLTICIVKRASRLFEHGVETPSTSSSGQGEPISDEDSPWEVSSDSDDDNKGDITDAKKNHPLSSSQPQTRDEPHELQSSLNLLEFIVNCLWRLPIRRPAPLDRMNDKSVAGASFY